MAADFLSRRRRTSARPINTAIGEKARAALFPRSHTKCEERIARIDQSKIDERSHDLVVVP